MKLHDDSAANSHAITACGAGYVAIDGRRVGRSVLVLPDRVDAEWGPPDFAGLTTTHLAALAALGCDVILLGTGERQQFPAPALLRPLIEARIPVEVMDTPAACRTYGILVAEGRRVAAALIVEAAA